MEPGGGRLARADIVIANCVPTKSSLHRRVKSGASPFETTPPGPTPGTAHAMQETSIKRAAASAAAPSTPAAASPSPARPGARKLYIRTFGCQMNEYDSDKMVDVLRGDQGLELTSTPEDADIILFNTCSVREKAQEKVFSDLGRVQHLKKINPELVIGVGGCVASQEGEAIVKRAPYVDVVFGPQTLHRLPELIQRRRSSGA